MRRARGPAPVVALALLVVPGAGAAPAPLRMAVMDPLSARLACPCVGGYAQRRYDLLAGRMSARLGRPVRVVYAERLSGALRQSPDGLDLVVGPRSVIEYDAPKAGVRLTPLARLTDRAGSTALTGVFVVRARDRARGLRDLRGRQVIFGPEYAPEKRSAALGALSRAGLGEVRVVLTRGTCTAAAADVAAGRGDAAVVSSYAVPLLVGCGAVQKGALRALGRTAPVPFVGAYGRSDLPEADREALRSALLGLRSDPALLRAMESRDGFVPWTEGWADWRGPRRDGLSADVPRRLPGAPALVWRAAMTGPSPGGVAATETVVIVSDKDTARERDIWRCLDAETGRPLWRIVYPAAGRMDVTNAPRATPVIAGDRVYLLGAFGRLLCVQLDTGRIVWSRDLPKDFGAERPTWGYSATPLVVGSLLVVNPGGPQASVVALDRGTGQVAWRAPGAGAAYASFIVGEFGGVRQVVGYDADSLGGWDLRTGERLWRLQPPEPGDYNVPTPIDLGGRLLVATENNGARIYGFAKDGRIVAEPEAVNREIRPDAASPVVVDGLVFGGRNALVCANPAERLRTCWASKDPAYDGYVSLIGGPRRLLALTFTGVLALVEATPAGYRPLGRLQLPGKDDAWWSHPALVADRLYLRSSSALTCLALSGRQGSAARAGRPPAASRSRRPSAARSGAL